MWPLQLMLLILTPKVRGSRVMCRGQLSHAFSQVLEEIYNADTGAPCSAKHVKKKQFIDSIKRALAPGHSSKAVTEAAAVTCVKLCKAATYVNILDSNNVIFSLVQTVINDLKNLLFKLDKPFSRGAGFIKEDIDIMIDCFLANFRINPHNNDTLKAREFFFALVLPNLTSLSAQFTSRCPFADLPQHAEPGHLPPGPRLLHPQVSIYCILHIVLENFISWCSCLVPG